MQAHLDWFSTIKNFLRSVLLELFCYLAPDYAYEKNYTLSRYKRRTNR